MEHDDSSQPIEEFLYELTNEKPRSFSHDELKIYTSDLKKNVGAGGFGDVYKGKLSNGVKIAVKVLRDNTKEIMRKQFMAEVGTMGKTSHRNLIKLYGYCFDNNMKALIYKYMKNGSFDKILFKNHLDIKWEKLHEIAIQIANGLSFLHEHCEPPIIHYDVKPDNVLIDSNLSPKIIDFGMARNSGQVEQSGYRGTSGYAAPEVGKGLQVAYKSDIYSFGMMLFEILRKKRNSEGPGWFPGEVGERVEKDELDEIILMCGIEKKNKVKAETLCVVALWCTQQKFQERKDMSTVVKMLQGEIPLEKPPNPFPFYDSSPESSLFGSHRRLPKFSPAYTKGPPEESARERAEVSTHKESGSSSTPRTPSKSTPVDLKRKNLKSILSNTSPKENALLQEGRDKDYKVPNSSKPQSLLVDGILKVQERKTNRKPNETETRSSEGRPSLQRELNDNFKKKSVPLKTSSKAEEYEKRCPPGGDNSVIFYTTMGGNNRDSDDMRSILQSHQIQMFERDITLSGYRKELRELMGNTNVPILFVKGRLIGGAEKVAELEKEAKLGILFDGIPKVLQEQTMAERSPREPRSSKAIASTQREPIEQLMKVHVSPKRRSSESLLESLEKLCPPGGGNSVIVYTTTGGNREPFTDDEEPPSFENPHFGKALYDFTAGGDNELNLTAGEEVEIDYEVEGWFYVKKKRPGRDGKMVGLVPVLYVSQS